ncbi:MAG: DUF2748 family protein [Alphaproteobacteria bacterium]|nr:DUF2748 family protein [Alphaproteobacteria bacterium]
MNRNLYHILAHRPALEDFETNTETEELAQRLVRSGLLRIDTGDKINFVRYSYPFGASYVIFSYRQLYDPHLVINTRNVLRYILKNQQTHSVSEGQLDETIQRLRYEVDKSPHITEEIELKIARALVQATHPVVLYLLLWEEVEMFVTYSYSIGDLLDVQSWESLRWNNGMQTTYGKDYAIFVSADGDPFDESKPGATQGDGTPALARLMIIAAQEMGHYSDIIRDRAGNPISRHSTNLNATNPKRACRQARYQDKQHMQMVLQKARKKGLSRLVEEQKQYQFYKEQHLHWLKRAFIKWHYKLGLQFFFLRCSCHKIGFLGNLPRQLRTPLGIEDAIGDMIFNIEPKADAYDSPNASVREALACVEAMARVPQQVQKWGHPFVRQTMPNLYHMYYHEVIPSCVKAYEMISGAKFRRKRDKQAFKKRFVGYFHYLWRVAKDNRRRRKVKSEE